MSTRVRVINCYNDRTNSTIRIVQSPESLDELDLEDWWEEIVFPLTGDGKGQSEYGIYEAIVTQSDLPELVGKSYGWEG